MPTACFPASRSSGASSAASASTRSAASACSCCCSTLAYKVNYSTDMLVIGAWLGAPAVALWAPAQRLERAGAATVESAQRSAVPDCRRLRRQRSARRDCALVFVHGTRLSLATVLPVAGGLAILAHPLLTAWIGPSFATTASIVQILAFVVIVRVGCLHVIGDSEGRGHAPAAHHPRRRHGHRQSRAQHRARRSARARRRRGRNGGAGGRDCRLWSRPRPPAGGSALSFVELFRERAVAGAVAGGASPGSLLDRAAERDFRPRCRRSRCSSRWAAPIYFALFLVAVGSEGRREYLRHVDVFLSRTPRPDEPGRHGKCFLAARPSEWTHEAICNIAARQERLSHVRALLPAS